MIIYAYSWVMCSKATKASLHFAKLYSFKQTRTQVEFIYNKTVKKKTISQSPPFASSSLDDLALR